jgi:hypothetical protein
VLNNSTEHGPSWETHSCTAGQDVSSISCNAKFHYRVHTTAQLIHIQIHMNPCKPSKPPFFNTRLYTIYSQVYSQCDYIPSGVPQHNAICFPRASEALLCLMQMYSRSYGIMVGTRCNDNWEIWINRKIYFIEPRTKLNLSFIY